MGGRPALCCQAVSKGLRSDIFVSLPTGAGKSLCYWLLPGLCDTFRAGADLGGGGGGGGPGGADPPPYMKNDVMHTVIYAAFCMLPF